MNLNDELKRLFREQAGEWELMRTNFANLAHVEQRRLTLGDVPVILQHNAARIGSSGAKVDRKSIAERPCFLCAKNRPAEQRAIGYHEKFQISANPFPILPLHATVIAAEHVPQSILPNIGEMLDLARDLSDFVVFYNGPKCGASAPDHMHFQAAEKGHLPLENDFENQKKKAETETLPNGLTAFHFRNFLRTCVAVESDDAQKLAEAFRHFHAAWQGTGDTDEPRMNVFCWHAVGRWTLCLFPRDSHRPTHYFDAENNLLVSPGAIDMGGIVILARRDDFERITPDDVREIFRQASRDVSEPEVSVGIMHAERISFVLHGIFRLPSGEKFSGEQTAELRGGQIFFQEKPVAELVFLPTEKESLFELKDVTIGVNFHWERKENQQFTGKLKFVADEGRLAAVNILPVENYLKSVISSEMSATADKELLKAHAVISRSWLLANMRNPQAASKRTEFVTDEETVRWYERNAHTRFDVCADDHCQRYQGITRTTTAAAAQAVDETRGEALVCDGEICDARFSKSCGGVSETFENCWADTLKAYLQPVADAPGAAQMPDLTDEREAEKWILGTPDSFCNTHDRKILAKVLNNYDQETADFFRWHVRYTAAELSALVARRSGLDFGEITELQPLQRGASGRIVRLKIVGTRRTHIVGKELEIRKWLSPSHLYSSAFVVEKTAGGFALHGAGWGHGAGLCQIGAAVMSERGCNYREILLHYYTGNTRIQKLY